MNSSKPYLLRAFYDWIMDNDMTPHVVVEATEEEVRVPEQYIEDGRIILNISAYAVQNLELEQNHVAFQAKFAGVPFDVYVPLTYVSAIYAKENGRGMVFKDEFEDEDPPPEADESSGSEGGSKSSFSSKSKKGRPNLTLVK